MLLRAIFMLAARRFCELLCNLCQIAFIPALDSPCNMIHYSVAPSVLDMEDGWEAAELIKELKDDVPLRESPYTLTIKQFLSTGCDRALHYSKESLRAYHLLRGVFIPALRPLVLDVVLPGVRLRALGASGDMSGHNLE